MLLVHIDSYSNFALVIYSVYFSKKPCTIATRCLNELIQMHENIRATGVLNCCSFSVVTEIVVAG